MNMMKTTLFCALLMTTAGVWAQTETTTQQAQKPITPYGKNPNILHVWAYKTQEGVINTVEKVGTATEKGIQKIRPSAHQALDSAKTITNNTAEQAKETGQQVTQNVNKKLHETKQVITGQTDQPAPIYQGSLSQPSSAPVDAPAVQAPSVSSPQPVAPQTMNEPTITQAPSSFTPAQAEEEIKVTKL